jgi:hypothetical protein
MEIHELRKLVKKEGQERRLALTKERAVILNLLTGLGIVKVKASYDGDNDFRNVDDFEITPSRINVSDKDKELLSDFIWGLASDLNPGMENSDGGSGDIIWQIYEDKIRFTSNFKIDYSESYDI